MRRITISLDDALVELAESEVAAGRAPSVSAWVAAAIRDKAQARAELIEDLAALERNDPTPPEVVHSLAQAFGLPNTQVARVLKRASTRRAGRRRR